MFSNKQLKDMIVPLFFEQLLVLLVGIADTFVISHCGEASVSGVSLVNSFNTIFIYLFTALASGGAVIISQYIGSKEQNNANRASSQLLMFSFVFSMALSFFTFIFHRPILTGLFGQVEQSVMEACVTYLKISVYSFPFLAVYNAGASLFRSLGKTKQTMYISLISNVINLVGNIIGVYVLNAGVAGVAVPSLLARMFSAIVITYMSFNQHLSTHYEKSDVFTWDKSILKKVLGIAIPNGIENGIFQFVKVALSSIIAMFGTYQIAANGISQSIWSLAALMNGAIAPVMITVIGQCMGANDLEQAKFYFKKLMKLNVALAVCWNAFIFVLTPFVVKFYNVTDQTKNLIIVLVAIHNLFNGFALPFSGTLSTGLRAAGDVKFTMIVSIASTVGGRFILSIILGVWLNLGVIGIAIAMCMDWVIRGVIFIFRYKSEKWTKFKLI